jgi:hypothetical protein
MQLTGLAWLSVLGLLVCTILIFWALRNENRPLVQSGLIFGTILCIADLIVELVGTYIGKWEYLESQYFIADSVPIELLPIFFSLGLVLTFVHYSMTQTDYTLSLDGVFLFMIIAGITVYILRASNGERVTLLMISVPLALWGLTQISDDKMRSLVLLFASFVAIADYLIEVVYLNSGNYSYAGGFRPETPLTYAMVTIAIMGALERYRSYKIGQEHSSEE